MGTKPEFQLPPGVVEEVPASTLLYQLIRAIAQPGQDDLTMEVFALRWMLDNNITMKKK